MTTPDDVIVKHLMSLRHVLVSASQQKGIPADRYNEIRGQLDSLDKQLGGMGIDVTQETVVPATRQTTRAERRAIRRKTGTGFSRMLSKHFGTVRT